MKKKIILHIGMGKTGTTALQDFFWENRGQLEKAGVFYPAYGAVAHAHHLLSPYRPKKKLKDQWPFKLPSEWMPELQKATHDRILLSSELIAWASADQVTEFCRCVQEHFDLTIVIYVRRQDNIIMANYNQLVKAGSQRREIDKIWEKDLDRFNYRKIIAPWSECLGKSQIIVRPYEKQQFYGHDIRRDFMQHVFGAKVSAEYVMPSGNSNPRLNSLAIAYKLRLCRLLEDRDQVARFNESLLSYSGEAHDSSDNIFLDQPLLSPAVRNDIIERSSAINEYIAREYLGNPDGKLFLEPLPNDASSWRGPELTGVEARNITRHIGGADAQLVQLLFEGVLSGLNSPEPGKKSAAMIFKASLPTTVAAGGKPHSLWKWRYRPEFRKGNDVPNMIISLHLPLVTVDGYLAEINNYTGSFIVQDYWDQPFFSGKLLRNIQALHGCIKTARQVYEGEEAVCVHGNFMPLKYRYLQTKLRKRYVTWIRDPVGRLVDHYSLWRSSSNLENASELRRRMLEDNWSFEKFSLCPELRNIYGQYLWGFSLRRFDFIGIAEYPELEIQRFSKEILNGTQGNIDLQSVELPSAHGTSCGVDARLRDRIERYHSADVSLYRRALNVRNKGLIDAVK